MSYVVTISCEFDRKDDAEYYLREVNTGFFDEPMHCENVSATIEEVIDSGDDSSGRTTDRVPSS